MFPNCLGPEAQLDSWKALNLHSFSSLGHAYVLPQEQGRVEGSSLLLPSGTAFQDSEPSGRIRLEGKSVIG